jgi:hypothetical protein
MHQRILLFRYNSANLKFQFQCASFTTTWASENEENATNGRRKIKKTFPVGWDSERQSKFAGHPNWACLPAASNSGAILPAAGPKFEM